MKVEQAECKKRRHIKFRRRGITQKKEYNSLYRLLEIYFMYFSIVYFIDIDVQEQQINKRSILIATII
jgi:hypothetical protein